MPGALIVAAFDVSPDREEEVLAWHNTEHLPERLSLNGFLSGRRFVNVEPGRPRFLIVYELVSADVVRSPAYLERLNNPTPWTRRSLQAFRHGTRTLVNISARFGARRGDLIALYEAPAQNSIPPCLGRDVHVDRIAWGVSDGGGSSIATEESALSRNQVQASDLVLIEAGDRQSLTAAAHRLVNGVPALVGKGRFEIQACLEAARVNGQTTKTIVH